MVTDRTLSQCVYCGVMVYSPCYRDDTPYCGYYWKVEEDKMQNRDMVNSPAHYNSGKVEVIEYILQVAANYPGDEAALVGNVIKYVSRAPLKGNKKQDLEKARWYLNKLIEIAE